MRASVEGTRRFLDRSGLGLFHQFWLSGLYVNPLIHGPPMSSSHVTNKELIFQERSGLVNALTVNKSNCMYIADAGSGFYGRYRGGLQDGKSVDWHLSENVFKEALAEASVLREEVVTMAGLGMLHAYPTGKSHELEGAIMEKLAEFAYNTNIEMIDYAFVEVNEKTMSSNTSAIEASLSLLQQLVDNGLLHGYGLHVDVRPYNYHTPSKHGYGPYALIPSLLEAELCSIQDRLSSAAVAIEQEDEEEEGEDRNEGIPRDKSSTVRSGWDVMLYNISPTTAIPTTYPMLEPSEDQIDTTAFNEDDLFDEKLREKNRLFTRIALNPLHCYMGDGRIDFAPMEMDKSTKYMERQEKTGEDIDVDNLSEEELANELQQLYKDLGAEDTPEVKQTAPVFNNDNCDDDGASGSDEGDTHLPRSGTAMRLISGIHAPRIEQHLGDMLNECCPALESSDTLQDKALRSVFSVGMDCAVLDSETAALVGKMQLEADDMVTPAESEDVFGYFHLDRDL